MTEVVSPPATTREGGKEELPSSRESLLCVAEVAIVPLQDYRRLTRHSKFVQKQPLRWLERLGHPLDVSLAIALLVLRRPTSRLRWMSRALSWAFSERFPELAVYNEKYSHQDQNTNVRLSFTDIVDHIQPIFEHDGNISNFVEVSL